MADFSPNPHGVDIKALDLTADGAPTAKLYHGFGIQANSQWIGRVTQWNPSQNFTRDVTHIYELGRNWGHPVDIVPGKLTGFHVSLARVELWGQEMERVLTGSDDVFENLMDQTKPFKINEFFYKGREVYKQFEYKGCWISEMNSESFSADGDGIIRVSCTIAYVRRAKI